MGAPAAMDSESRVDTIHKLELQHQDEIHQSNMVAKEEESRRLRLRMIVLKDEKAILSDKLAQNESQIKAFSAERDSLRSELSSLQQERRSQLRSQTREVATLKAELESMNTVSHDSTKLLTEKLALARELSNLKPELEHLRSQRDGQQSLVAEKLALQRQVDSLEVELEAEKRARQRAAQKETSQKESASDVEDELRRKLKEAEKKLAVEKADKERIKKESDRALSEATGKAELLEQRVDMLKTKLRDSHDELKRCRAELESLTQSSVSEPSELTVAVKNPIRRKRRANETGIEDGTITIQTPNGLDTRANRPAKKKTVAGAPAVEKSMFSITPFLNKTASFADESLDTPGSPTAEHAPVQAGAKKEKKAAKTLASDILTAVESAPAVAPKPRGRPRKVLVDASASKKNIPVTKGAKPAKDTTISLEKVVEEVIANAEVVDVPQDDVPIVVEVVKAKTTKKAIAASDEGQENQLPAKQVAKIAKSASVVSLKAAAAADAARRSSAESTGTEAEPKKKKRKLLGAASKTLFDGDDEEAEAAPPPTKRSAKVQLGGGAAVATRAVGKGFSKTTFSPLKKDRRGVNASFLA